MKIIAHRAKIDNYKENIRRLAKAGVKCICYNFMPVFDWTRSRLDQPLYDGSNALVYYKEDVWNHFLLWEIKNEKNRKEEEAVNKRFANYFSFIHSILSTSELTILFYNSMLFPKAKELYVKYGMFNNLLKTNLIKQEHSNLIEGANLKEKKELFQEIIDRFIED